MWSQAGDAHRRGASRTAARAARAPRPGDIAQILFTSGTTGRPKGVVARHANLTAGLQAHPRQRALAHSQHFVHALPIGTNAGQTMLLNALTATPTALAMTAYGSERLCRLIELHRIGTAPVYAMLVILSVALTFQRLAYTSAVAQLVPKRHLGHANGLVQTSNGIAQFVVPIVAVTALSVFDIGGILVIDALSYLVSISVVGLLRFPDTLAHTRRESLLTEIVTGMRYSLGRSGLRAMLFYFAILNVFLSPAGTVARPCGPAGGLGGRRHRCR